MKKRYAALALILCLTLAGCAPRRETAVPSASPSPTVTADPEPSKTPAPSAAPVQFPDFEKDPKGCLLACLDKTMEGETVFMRFWQHPGSGPSPEYLPVDYCGQALRELFSALDWEVTEYPEYDEEEALNVPYNQPGAYSVSIYYDDGESRDGYIQLGTGDPVAKVEMFDGTEVKTVYLRADGAEELCDRIADLIPGLYINLGRTRVLPQESQEATLKLYLETALERLRENGHITDYDLWDYRIISPEELGSQPTEEEYPYIQYTITYAFKPTHPELFRETEDGWVEATWGEEWDVIGYDARDGRYGMV